MGGGKDKQSAMDLKKKQKTVTPVWRPVCTQAVSDEECLVKDVVVELDDGSQVQELQCSTSSNVSNVQHAMKTAEVVTEISDSTISSSALQDNVLEVESELSTKKHSISIEVVKSPNLDYSHFISLPLAIHPELVNKLLHFQNSILGNSDGCPDENWDSDSNEDTTDIEDGDRQLDKQPDVAVELKVVDGNEHVKVNISKIPLVSYPPKASKSSLSGDLGIDKSIFIKPKTFHLTVLMLKLWNKDRVNAAAEVLQSISSKVMDALDNRPVSIRLKGLDCMRGSLAKARVLFAPVEEIGSEDRLLRACQVIIDAYVEAGLVLEKDANQKLKLDSFNNACICDCVLVTA
uniref:A-kinase anchor protein 7-like phosphoesterase domain-containing protein n=1 Tax=Fagus sylvatica TaxID=28930 RepID=A0A2N9HQI7_FAGSY